MANGRALGGLGHEGASLVGGASGACTDAELLGRYLDGQDPEAFEAMLARHGPRVLRVCRQVLGRSADAEDAFQSTFLLLARKAGSIRRRESLGHWLHGVAHRVAVRSRANARRREARERVLPIRPDGPPPGAETDLDELRQALHEEIDRLPERLRRPILLCYLEGRTTADAARLVGCPASTLKERLSTGREQLRRRLSRRGLTLTALLLMLLLMPGRTPADEVPPRLLAEALRKAPGPRRPGRGRGVGPPAPLGRRLLVASAVAAILLGVGVAAVLAAPTPRRGTWLFWFLEAARKFCH
jgi:RNA polymerase sigma factor (sigma-70 family)